MPTDVELAAAADEALLRALQLGQSVQFGDRTWTSHDLKKLLDIRASLTTASGAAGSRLAAFSKGTD